MYIEVENYSKIIKKKPVLKNRTSKNGLYSFEFESPSTDELIYFKLIDLNDIGRFENN